MKVSEQQMISTRRLVALPNNPRKITNENLNRLCDSIRNNGYWQHRPAAVEPIEGTDNFYVLDGNQRLKALRRLKRKEMLCVIYTDLTDEERDDIILRSNINNGEWDTGLLQSDFEGVDFESIGLNIELPEIEPPTSLTPDPAAAPQDLQSGGNEYKDLQSDNGDGIANADTQHDGIANPAEQPEDGRGLSFYFRMMGDFLYPSDNEFDIPTLLTDNMPVHLELPLNPWGAEARYKKGITTFHFYVDDYRFEHLFRDPIKLLESGCRAIVEPNCSIHDQTPMAHAIWQTYRKRYLCRYLQECGLQIWVDLNVSPHFEEVNALGVPQGYNAFCTRGGLSNWEPVIERHYAMAQRISGLEKPNMFVYGGGEDVHQWCMKHDVLHVKEYVNNSRVKRNK